MTVRFLADEDLNGDIVEAVRLREPSIDILDVKGSALRGRKDSEILEIAASEMRIVVSHDRRTMTAAFWATPDRGQTHIWTIDCAATRRDRKHR